MTTLQKHIRILAETVFTQENNIVIFNGINVTNYMPYRAIVNAS